MVPDKLSAPGVNMLNTVITLCFRTPFVFGHHVFHRNNYFLDAQKQVFRTPFVFGHPYFSPK